VGGLGDRGTKSVLDLIPEDIEGLSVGIFGHPRPTIAAPGTADFDRAANAEENGTERLGAPSVYCDATERGVSKGAYLELRPASEAGELK
jgi:hypothetical protein